MTAPGATPEPPASNEPAENTPEWYRANIERVSAENKELKGKLREGMFKQVGLHDTSKGLGKTMADAYDGDLDPEAFKAWAAERFEWQPPQAGNGEQQQQTPEQVAAQTVVSESQGRVEQATQTATSTETPPSGSIQELKAQIAEAEAAGNYVDTIRLKREWTQRIAQQQQPLPN